MLRDRLRSLSFFIVIFSVTQKDETMSRVSSCRGRLLSEDCLKMCMKTYHVEEEELTLTHQRVHWQE